MLYDQLKEDRMSAMKAGDKERKVVLTTFVGELQSQEKRGLTLSDDYVIGQIKKVIQVNKDVLATHESEKHQAEIDVLEQYLPRQMTEEELGEAIDAIIASEGEASMKVVMPKLKELHGGLYDGKLASSMVRDRTK